ncbi:MBL fold metallo-hydrolase [Catenovulum sp. 2E275]|uniref:MBL fold metallo-hydrolase n=1 Tax=Catenovulum sp. 2E275 TaxID=2980497 RepID=UPI0021D3ABB0|nr:MBL fold metallo-hydrolase [Catenovulum sp. 2E275]MCU4677131.1 MBL fold metallo-hydrolase [Catenovulum sp. 2E275]
MNQLVKTCRQYLSYISFASILLCSSAYAADAVFKQDDIQFSAISHATFVAQIKNLTIYIDPVGKKSDFEKFPKPDLILITDIHYDHLKPELVKSLAGKKTQIVAPKAVAEKLTGLDVTVLNNKEKTDFKSLTIEAVAMYNLTEDRLKYHEKGRGNGYVIHTQGKRIYISGDTEDVPEMRALKKIDYAFICMNLPYTMTVEQAADAVIQMKPKMVFPYHYRGTDGFSDVDKFKRLVTEGSKVKVQLLKWY